MRFYLLLVQGFIILTNSYEIPQDMNDIYGLISAATADTNKRKLHWLKQKHASPNMPIYQPQLTPQLVPQFMPQLIPPPMQSQVASIQQVVLPPVAQVVQIQQIIRETSCPQDMILDNKQCIGIISEPAIPTCPDNFIFNGRSCDAVCNPLISCEPGYAMDANGSCFRVIPVSPTLTCSEGEELDSSTNTCISLMQDPPCCPPGYMQFESQCVQRVQASSQCPPGFNFGSVHCEQREVSPAFLVCPEGSQVKNDLCITIKHQAPECPSPFSFDPELQTCIKAVPQLIEPCPSGYTASTDGCQSVSLLSVTQDCPDTYELQDGLCVREQSGPLVCPQGFQLAGDICQQLSKPHIQCPLNSEESSYGQCKRQADVPRIECCPSEFELVGNSCHKEELYDAEYSCATNCFRVVTKPAAFACPVDTEFVNNNEGFRCIGKQQKAMVLNTPCATDIQSLAYGLQNEKAEPGCGLQEIVSAYAHCPEGGELVGDQCITHEPIIPEPRCPIGTFDLSRNVCSHKLTKPVTYECPSNSTLRDLKCIIMENVEPELVCPKDSEFTEGYVACIKTTKPMQAPPFRSVIAPNQRCPENTILENGQCKSILLQPQAVSCPASTELASSGDKCISRAPLFVPPPIETRVRGSFQCPNNMMRQGTSCVSYNSVAPLNFCPSPYTLDSSGSCSHAANPVYPPPRAISRMSTPQCPPGSHGQGMSCVMVATVAPQAHCREGFQPVDNRCVKSIMPNLVCSVGMTLSEGNCVREIVVSPTVTLQQGCVIEPDRASNF